MATTFQSDSTLAALTNLGHATTLQLHTELVKTMPRLTVQSVHRITARLIDRGQVRLGPSDGHSLVLDARTDVHDHFVCMSCGGIIDLDMPESVIAGIQGLLGRNLVRDGITIQGRCESCATAAHSAASGSGSVPQRPNK